MTVMSCCGPWGYLHGESRRLPAHGSWTLPHEEVIVMLYAPLFQHWSVSGPALLPIFSPNLKLCARPKWSS
eukprot:jgi/Botrbrau1/22629/Bobra.176_1s0056.1